mgnify:FL=1
MGSKKIRNLALCAAVLLVAGCSNTLGDEEAKAVFDQHNDLYTYDLVSDALSRGDRLAAQAAVQKRNYLKRSLVISDCASVEGTGAEAEGFDYVRCTSTLPPTRVSGKSEGGLIFSRTKGSETWVFLKSTN